MSPAIESVQKSLDRAVADLETAIHELRPHAELEALRTFIVNALAKHKRKMNTTLSGQSYATRIVHKLEEMDQEISNIALYEELPQQEWSDLQGHLSRLEKSALKDGDKKLAKKLLAQCIRLGESIFTPKFLLLDRVSDIKERLDTAASALADGPGTTLTSGAEGDPGDKTRDADALKYRNGNSQRRHSKRAKRKDEAVSEQPDELLNSKQGSEASRRVCKGCGEVISGGSRMKALGGYWHPEHFVCTKCTKPLSSKFLTHSDKPYCAPCFTASFAPKCADCGERIKGKKLVAMEKTWHPDHFVCHYCRTPLRKITPYLYQGKQVCQTHKAGPLNDSAHPQVPSPARRSTSTSKRSRLLSLDHPAQHAVLKSPGQLVPSPMDKRERGKSLTPLQNGNGNAHGQPTSPFRASSNTPSPLPVPAALSSKPSPEALPSALVMDSPLGASPAAKPLPIPASQHHGRASSGTEPAPPSPAPGLGDEMGGSTTSAALGPIRSPLPLTTGATPPPVSPPPKPTPPVFKGPTSVSELGPIQRVNGAKKSSGPARESALDATPHPVFGNSTTGSLDPPGVTQAKKHQSKRDKRHGSNKGAPEPMVTPTHDSPKQGVGSKGRVTPVTTLQRPAHDAPTPPSDVAESTDADPLPNQAQPSKADKPRKSKKDKKRDTESSRVRAVSSHSHATELIAEIGSGKQEGSKFIKPKSSQGKSKDSSAGSSVKKSSEARAGHKDKRISSRDWKGFDALAKAAPKEACSSISGLANYLGQAESPVGRMRAIFTWVARNIKYDAKAFFNGKATPETCSAEYVLKHRKAVCEGYANLTKALADGLQLEVEVVPGFSKGVGFDPSRPPEAPDHAWNAMRIDGKWHLLDACWGAGILVGKQFQRRLQPHYFMCPPAQFLVDHFPSEAKWQLVSKPISRDVFISRPVLKPDFFQYRLRLHSHKTAIIQARDQLVVVLKGGESAQLSATLSAIKDRSSKVVEQSTFVRRADGRHMVHVAVPKKGVYNLVIFVKSQSSKSTVARQCMSYRVECSELSGGSFMGLPNVFSAYTAARCTLTSPIQYYLEVGKAVTFSIEVPKAKKVVITSLESGKPTHLTCKDRTWTADFVVPRGKFGLYADMSGGEDESGPLTGLVEFCGGAAGSGDSKSSDSRRRKK